MGVMYRKVTAFSKEQEKRKGMTEQVYYPYLFGTMEGADMMAEPVSFSPPRIIGVSPITGGTGKSNVLNRPDSVRRWVKSASRSIGPDAATPWFMDRRDATQDANDGSGRRRCQV